MMGSLRDRVFGDVGKSSDGTGSIMEESPSKFLVNK